MANEIDDTQPVVEQENAPPPQTFARPPSAPFSMTPGSGYVRGSAGTVVITPPQMTQDEREVRALQQSLAGLPIDQAYKAINAALKFQAQRGYQADLAAGKSPNEALAKWGIKLFGDHPQMFSGAVTKSFTPPPPAPTYIPANPTTGQPGSFQVPGRLPLIPKVPVTPGPAKLDQLTQFDLHTKAGAVTAAQRAVSAAVASGNEEAIDSSRVALKAATDDYSKFREGLSKTPTVAAPKEAPKTRGVESKIQRAKQLRQQHPNWTKQQILDVVASGQL